MIDRDVAFFSLAFWQSQNHHHRYYRPAKTTKPECGLEISMIFWKHAREALSIRPMEDMGSCCMVYLSHALTWDALKIFMLS
jgi:hypothetical protein